MCFISNLFIYLSYFHSSARLAITHIKCVVLHFSGRAKTLCSSSNHHVDVVECVMRTQRRSMCEKMEHQLSCVHIAKKAEADTCLFQQIYHTNTFIITHTDTECGFELAAGTGPESLNSCSVLHLAVSLHSIQQIDINDDNRGKQNYLISLACCRLTQVRFRSLDKMENVFQRGSFPVLQHNIWEFYELLLADICLFICLCYLIFLNF